MGKTKEIRKRRKKRNITKNKDGLIDYKRLNILFDARTRDMNDELVKKHFLVQDLGSLLEKL